MKKDVKNILIPVLVLVIISLISGLLLSIVNQFTIVTAEELEERTKDKINQVYECKEGFEKIEYTPSMDEKLDDDIKYFYKALDGKNVYIVVSTGKGYGGDVEMYTIFQDRKIVKITKGTNKETPGVSDNAFEKDNFEKYYNIDIIQIDGFVLGGTQDNSVDAVSGATFSSKGILGAVSSASKYYKEYYMEVLS